MEFEIREMEEVAVSEQAVATGRFRSKRVRPASWWLGPNLLALDAPVVAVVWLHAFARAYEALVPWPVSVGLFLVVWCIYLADRLIDARCLGEIHSATNRHLFAARHGREMFAVLVLAMASGGWLALTRIDAGLLHAAGWLMLAVTVYFGAFVRLARDGRVLPAKEVVCGAVFAAGCALGVDAIRMAPLGAVPIVALFAALCSLNCLLISAWEKDNDRRNDSSAAGRWWRSIDRDLGWMGALLILLSLVAVIWTQQSIYSAMLASSLLLTALHITRGNVWSTQVLRRVLADAVLLTPLLSFLS